MDDDELLSETDGFDREPRTVRRLFERRRADRATDFTKPLFYSNFGRLSATYFLAAAL